MICAFYARVLDMNRSQGLTQAACGTVLLSTISCFIVGNNQDELAPSTIIHFLSKRYTENRALGITLDERFCAVVSITYPCRLLIPGSVLNLPKVRRRTGVPVAGQSMVSRGLSFAWQGTVSTKGTISKAGAAQRQNVREHVGIIIDEILILGMKRRKTYTCRYTVDAIASGPKTNTCRYTDG